MTLADHDAETNDHAPRLAIRRHTDRCFFEVEERAPGGYIVDGYFIRDDEVAEVRSMDGDQTRSCNP